MNTLSIHIDETLVSKDIKILKATLTSVPHVCNVEFNALVPHDLMVEYEEHHNVPVTVLEKLREQGLHPDIQYC